MKKILLLLLILLCTSCMAKPKTISEIYPEIINECVLVESKQEDIKAMLNKGTGIVFFSWSQCPWCHDYINIVNEAARLNDMQVLYYDIYDDRDNNSEFYKDICTYLEPYLDNCSYQTNNTNKQAFDSNGKVRIYVPMVIFVNQGKVEYINFEGSMEEDHDKNSEAFWSELNKNNQTRKQALIEIIETYTKKVSDIKKQLDNQGCDDACVIEEE